MAGVETTSPMLLSERRQLALEDARRSREVNREVSRCEGGSPDRRVERKDDGGRGTAGTDQAKAGTHSGVQHVPDRRLREFIAGERRGQPRLDDATFGDADRTTGVQVDPR